MKNSSNHFVSYSNLDYTDDIITYQSIIRYVFYFAEKLIVYRLNLLKTVTLFTIKSEYIMLCMTAQKTI